MAWVAKYRAKDGRTTYQVGWRDPARKTHKKTFRLRRDADDFARRVEGEKQRGDYTDPALGRITLREYFEKIISTADVKPSTRALYRGTADRHVLPRFGNRPLHSISVTDVRDLLASLADRPATARGVHRLLRRVLSAAVDDGRIGKNPASRVRAPREHQREQRFLTVEELHRLADEVPERYRALVILMGYSGLRIGECAALRVSDVDFLRGRIRVHRNSVEVEGKLVEGLPKGGAARTVRIPQVVVVALARHVERFPGERLFTGDTGRPLRQSRFRTRIFAPAVKAAGLAPLRVHDLRHTAVAFAIAAGWHARQIQQLAGHASITTTFSVYGHLLESAQDEAVKRLDALASRGAQKTF